MVQRAWTLEGRAPIPRAAARPACMAPSACSLLFATFQSCLGHGPLWRAAPGPDPHETSWGHCSSLSLVPWQHHWGGVSRCPVLEGHPSSFFPLRFGENSLGLGRNHSPFMIFSRISGFLLRTCFLPLSFCANPPHSADGLLEAKARTSYKHHLLSAVQQFSCEARDHKGRKRKENSGGKRLRELGILISIQAGGNTCERECLCVGS